MPMTTDPRARLLTELDTALSRLKDLTPDDRPGGTLGNDGSGVDMDAVVGAESAEMVYRTGEAQRQKATAIRQALGRLDDGTYGTCTQCGETIPAKRLDAVPWAARCLPCAARNEGARA